MRWRMSSMCNTISPMNSVAINPRCSIWMRSCVCDHSYVSHNEITRVIVPIHICDTTQSYVWCISCVITKCMWNCIYFSQRLAICVRGLVRARLIHTYIYIYIYMFEVRDQQQRNWRQHIYISESNAYVIHIHVWKQYTCNIHDHMQRIRIHYTCTSEGNTYVYVFTYGTFWSEGSATGNLKASSNTGSIPSTTCMCDMTRWYVWRDSLLRVTWLILWVTMS